MSELRRISELYKKARALGRGDALYGRWLEALYSSTVSEFESAGIVVRVDSSVLGEEVYLVSDEGLKKGLEMEDVDPGCIYTARELSLLLRAINSPDDLREVHKLKKQLGGTLVDLPPGLFGDEGVVGGGETEPVGELGVSDAELVTGLSFSLRQLEQNELSKLRISLGRLTARIALCKRCPLCRSRTRVVPGEGYPGSIILVGEGPGRQEDATGRPFVGKAGKFLDKLLSSIGLKREDVYITNVVKCRPVGTDGRDRAPTEEEVGACGVFLKQQLLLIEPELVVALGSTALNYFIPGAYVQEYRGRFIRRGSFVIFSTYHPAAAFYKPELREAIEEDFESLGRAVVR